MRGAIVVAVTVAAWGAGAQEPDKAPKTIAYSAQPNAYFNDHAEEVGRIYDGLFFVVGSWDEGASAQLGIGSGGEVSTQWKDLARENLARLRDAGVTENFLGVYFGDSGAWPSPETLLSPDYGKKMATQFGAIARAARELGFRGICVDVEYPYPRYSLDHTVYTYENYTAEDLLSAAAGQGRAVTAAMLDAYPDAVILLLPGSLWCRAIARTFQLAILETMAERDAPGGLHLFTERSYCLLDPVSQVAIPREGDLAVRALVHEPKVLDYWQRRCTVAPGVWPLHMIETGGKDYPVRPWSKELAELRQQMEILRSVAKRYTWSFSSHAMWHPYTKETADRYGLGIPPFEGVAEVVAEWHRILAQKGFATDLEVLRLVRFVHEFDRGTMGPADLCGKLGTPGEWMALGPLANPFAQPAYSAPGALLRPIRRDEPIPGRDGVVRWFTFPNYEPLGSIRVMAAFDWFKTDNAAVHLVSTVVAERQTQANLHVNWDDGIAVWLGDTLVYDHRTYPERGHGLLFKDRYNFEEVVPVTLPKGETRLAVTCINQAGGWGVNIRFTDKNGWPIDGITFRLPSDSATSARE